ncbi:glycosyltransferase family 2 protein [Candidatus Saccharibacteria bacterium]|jgi:GT2 family glycosyltransferase|nr:glycosyltransferase family 2 protein [Candidatus Saccharibacteria bacterium]
MSRVATIVLNWNGIEDTERCLNSIYKQIYKKQTVILVDNGSTERGTQKKIKALKQKYPNLIVLNNQKNLGFAGGVNTGIKYALKNSFDFIALLNNDAVADKNWLLELIEAQKKHDSGITTGLLLHSDGKTIDSTGDWCSIWGLPFPRDRNKSTKEASRSGFVFSGSGGASLYSIEMLQEVGLFDEAFFAYYEDTDISFRAQLYGWKVYYTDKAIAYHKQGATSDKIPGFTIEQTFKNLPLFIIKNIPITLLPSVGLRFWLAYTLMFGNAVKKGVGWSALKGFLRHIAIFWSNSLWKRFVIQRQKKVSNVYIKDILWPDLPPDQTGLRKFRSLFTSKY